LEIEIPMMVTSFDHTDIVEEILKLNPHLHKPQRSAWPQSLPDLEEPFQHIAVEVELSDLRNGWGQCLYYHRMGAKEVHFILAPTLYNEYKRKEEVFINENPIPNVRVYNLPSVPPPTKSLPSSTEVQKKKTYICHKQEKFVVDSAKDKVEKRSNMHPVTIGDLRFVDEETELYKNVMSKSIKVGNLLYCSKRGRQVLITVKVGVIVDNGMFFNDWNYSMVK